MHRALTPVLATLAFVIAGCDRSEPPTGDPADVASSRSRTQAPSIKSPARRDLDGARFVSRERHEVGLGPDGTVFGFWSVGFKDGIASWSHSDVEESGAYSIADDGTITAEMGPNGIRGSLDSGSDALLWDGAWYEPVNDDGA